MPVGPDHGPKLLEPATISRLVKAILGSPACPAAVGVVSDLMPMSDP
jgi:hypothetical protein